MKREERGVFRQWVHPGNRYTWREACTSPILAFCVTASVGYDGIAPWMTGNTEVTMREGEGFGQGTCPVWIDWNHQIWSVLHATSSIRFRNKSRSYLIDLTTFIVLFCDVVVVGRLRWSSWLASFELWSFGDAYRPPTWLQCFRLLWRSGLSSIRAAIMMCMSVSLILVVQTRRTMLNMLCNYWTYVWA